MNKYIRVGWELPMIQFYYLTFIHYINLYYKEAVILGIMIFCINHAASYIFDAYQKKNTIALVICVLYLYAVFVITLRSRIGSRISEVNVIPFSFIHKYAWEKMCFLVNIILFVPMPIFLYLLFPVFRKFKNSLFFGLIISIVIELLQWLLHCGWCDIDDVISNTFGVAVGWICIHSLYQYVLSIICDN